jgi:hypothetical protein
VSATAGAGARSATLTGTPGTYIAGAGLTSASLSISDHGTVVLSGPLDPPTETVVGGVFLLGGIGVTPSASPATATVGAGSLCVARFAGQVTPTVLLAFSTGGAHCCVVLRAYPPAPGGVGRPVDDNLGDPGAQLQILGDHAVLVSADDAFAYRFDSFAGSALPLMVLEVRDGAFVDVTREHLDLVRADADRYAPDATSEVGPGSIAAWVADECLLGMGTQAFATVDTLVTQGKLHGSPIAGPDTSGKAYELDLRTFLTQKGYCLS